MKISVLHIITTIDLGGAEKQLLTLASCQREKGYHVEVIYLKGKPSLAQDFLDQGIIINNTYSAMSFFKQIWKMRRRRFDKQIIVHAHLPRAELLSAITLKTKSFIVTRHNSEPFFPKAPTWISRALSRYVLYRAFASVSISKAVADYLNITGELGSSNSNQVINYGIKDISVKQIKKIKDLANVFQIGTVSRLVPQKNIPLLLTALKNIDSAGTPNVHLSVVGSGPLSEELKTLSIQLGIEKSVSWLGQTKDTLSFFRSLDVFVLTSDYEGFGLVMLEAMTQGVPVIARRLSAIPEVLGEDHPGLIDSNRPEDIADKIRDFLTDSRIFENCLDYQSKRLREFPISQSQASHEDLYLKLLKHNQEGHSVFIESQNQGKILK